MEMNFVMNTGGGATVVRSVADLRSHVSRWHAAGARVALVPTMGALHAGHMSLVTEARQRADRVVKSIDRKSIPQNTSHS